MVLEGNKTQFCQKELKQNMDELMEIRSRLRNYGDELGTYWIGNDEKTIENELDNIDYQLTRIITDLDELTHDILMYGKNSIQ